jgi:DNA polymerase III alpha subunit
MSYIPLHVHTEYSLLDGMSTVKELFERANELGMRAIAITDHGTLAGVEDFFNHAKRFYPDIKPILGNEIYFAGCPNHNQKEGERKRYYHLILLAKNLQGYNNLCKISSTAAAGDIYKGRAIVDYDTLVANHEGLICMSACIGGEIPQYILKDDMEGAEMTFSLKSAFIRPRGKGTQMKLSCCKEKQMKRYSNSGKSSTSPWWQQTIPILHTSTRRRLTMRCWPLIAARKSLIKTDCTIPARNI